MSGLQEIAAIVGVTESAFRSISALYNFLVGLKYAPAEVVSLRNQISTLEQVFATLTSLKGLGQQTQELFERIGLPEAIGACGQACDRLNKDINKWTQSGIHSWKSKLQFRLHKKAVDIALIEIRSTKETALLAVIVAQLYLQLQHAVTEREKRSLIDEAKIVAKQMSTQTSTMGSEPPWEGTCPLGRTISGSTPDATSQQASEASLNQNSDRSAGQSGCQITVNGNKNVGEGDDINIARVDKDKVGRGDTIKLSASDNRAHGNRISIGTIT